MTTHYRRNIDGTRTETEPGDLEPITFGEAFNPEAYPESQPVATTGPEGLLDLLDKHGGKTSLTSWFRERAREFALQWKAERDEHKPNGNRTQPDPLTYGRGHTLEQGDVVRAYLAADMEGAE